MSWFRRRPLRRAPAPTFSPKLTERIEPKPAPIEVIEELDPSDSMILRVKDAIVKKWKGD